MALSNNVIQTQTKSNGLLSGAALLEKVMTTNDLAGLTSSEKISHIKNVCESLGLNPLTCPIKLIKFDGKETMYVSKDATEQLRTNHNVSVTQIETKIMNDLYVVTAHATLPNGRVDASTGVVAISGLKGKPLCNAMLMAETKAKRRVTLSICGLGFMDESEAMSIPGATKVELVADDKPSELRVEVISNESRDIDQDLLDISWAENLEDLQGIFTPAYKFWVSIRDTEKLKRLIDAKDNKKREIESVPQLDEEIINE